VVLDLGLESLDNGRAMPMNIFESSDNAFGISFLIVLMFRLTQYPILKAKLSTGMDQHSTFRRKLNRNFPLAPKSNHHSQIQYDPSRSIASPNSNCSRQTYGSDELLIAREA
jgi:hypothetical protein